MPCSGSNSEETSWSNKPVRMSLSRVVPLRQSGALLQRRQVQPHAPFGHIIRHEKSENLSAAITAVPQRVGGHEGSGAVCGLWHAGPNKKGTVMRASRLPEKSAIQSTHSQAQQQVLSHPQRPRPFHHHRSSPLLAGRKAHLWPRLHAPPQRPQLQTVTSQTRPRGKVQRCREDSLPERRLPARLKLNTTLSANHHQRGKVTASRRKCLNHALTSKKCKFLYRCQAHRHSPFDDRWRSTQKS